MAKKIIKNLTIFLLFSFSVTQLSWAAQESEMTLALDASSDKTAGMSEVTANGDVQLITMSFDNAPLTEVLKIFSEQTGMNFVTSQEIESKTATVHFEDVPVQDALDSIMSANNLRYRQKEGSSVYIVYAGDFQDEDIRTKIFYLKYARLSSSPLDVGGEKTTSLLAETSGGISSGSLSNSNNSSSSSSSNNSSSGSTNNNSNSSTASTGATASKGIDLVISSLLSKYGKLTMDLQSNSLIVMDTPDKLKEIEKIIKELDVPSAQVMLEVYIMEVKKNLLDDLGVEWGGDDGAMGLFTSGTVTSTFPFREDFLGRFQADAVTGSKSTVTLGSFSGSNLKATLHSIMDHTDTKILARPRILTLNNEAATIKLATNAAISSITAQILATNSTSSTTVDRTEIGINLKMTPQINADDSVVLFLEPSFSTSAVSDISSSFRDPTVRSVRTMAQVKNHDTLVIGGLIDSNLSDQKKKIPLLGDIPLLGYAFKYQERDELQRELLIFITPHIIRPNKKKGSVVSIKDPNAKRVIKQFEQDEIQRSVIPFSDSEKKYRETYHAATKNSSNKPVFIQKPVIGPLVDEEMTKTLNNFTPNNTKGK